MAGENRMVTIYEDEAYDELYPLTYLRPAFQVLCGLSSLVDRAVRLLPGARINLVTRKQFSELLSLLFPEFSVNEPSEKSGLFLNGRILSLPEVLVKNVYPKAFMCEGKVVGFWVDEPVSLASETGVVAEDTINEVTKRLQKEEVEIEILKHPWDLIRYNSKLLEEDFITWGGGRVSGMVDALAVVHGDVSLLSLGKGSRIGPFCVVDLTGGPAFIGDDVVISAHSVIKGPCYIGNGTRIESAAVGAGTSIGPVCRISGEVESTIFQGWSNKRHLGYVGHSWLGEWTNLGAGTNNSNLKNNYGTVRLGPEGSRIDSQMLNLGCFIGDHSKTGIGCLLNTGSIVGPFCNLLGGAISPGYAPPFSWQGPDGFEEYRLEAAVDVARVVMSRRSVEMSEAYESVVRDLFEQVRRRRE